MSLNIVPKERTAISAESCSALLVAAWGELTGSPPSANLASNLCSLIWIETGSGKSLYNWNFGNITASTQYGGSAWRPPWYDTTDGNDRYASLHAAMLQGKAPSAFRAYGSASDGMRDFLSVLRRSFPEVLSAGEQADSEGFREALSVKYSRDYANTHATSTLDGFRAMFLQLVGGLVPSGGGVLVTSLLVLAVPVAVYALWRLHS